VANKHHYLPQFYLRKFTSRGQRNLLWDYDKDAGTVVASTPKKSAGETGYHSFESTSGTDNDTIEQRIKQDFEDPMVPVYEKIRHRQILDEREWRAFHLFAASIMVRVPNYIANTQATMTTMYRRMFDIAKMHDPEFRARCVADGVPIEALEAASVKTATRSAALTMSLATVLGPAEMFCQMQWRFLHSPVDMPFVTSDNPVFYCDPEHKPGFFQGVGLANKTIEVTFPLTRTICALGTWQESKQVHQDVGIEVVDLINPRTVGASLRFAYGSEKSDRLLDLVRVTKGSSPKIICS
jgi:hypothetical protein